MVRSYWLLLPLLISCFWKTAIVFQVETVDSQNGYKVGFRTYDGTQKILDTKQTSHVFRMLIGREDITFFAVDAKTNEEITLKQLARENRWWGKFSSSPLL